MGTLAPRPQTPGRFGGNSSWSTLWELLDRSEGSKFWEVGAKAPRLRPKISYLEWFEAKILNANVAHYPKQSVEASTRYVHSYLGVIAIGRKLKPIFRIRIFVSFPGCANHDIPPHLACA